MQLTTIRNHDIYFILVGDLMVLQKGTIQLRHSVYRQTSRLFVEGLFWKHNK